MATLSFAHDIRAMFRDKDVQEMMDIAHFDLSNYADVRAHAADIYERVADGSMPCDGAWSAEQIAKFKQWLDEGMGLRVPGSLVKRSKLRKGGSPNTALVQSLG